MYNKYKNKCVWQALSVIYETFYLDIFRQNMKSP